MDISKESIGNLNERIRIRLTPQDYQPQLETAIRKTRKQVKMPGFRPGHVPEGLVRKMYGKSLLVEELNKIVSQSLENYITDSKLDILGQPLPMKDGEANNFDTPGDFEFSFELGLSPGINLELPPRHVFPYYVIKVEPDKVDAHVESMRKRHGEVSHPDQTDPDSMIQASITQVDAAGQHVEGGIATQNTLLIEKVADAESRKKLTGLRVGEAAVLDIKKAFDETEAAYLLGLEKDALKQAGDRFEVRVSTINNIKKAELDQALFDKVYGPGAVQDINGFTEKVTAEIADMYKTESDRKLAHDIEDELLKVTGVELPDDFLKRWLREANEKPVTEEAIEKEYGNYARRMKWKLIEKRIVTDQQISVTKEEMNNYSRHYVARQLSQYGGGGLTGELIDQMASKFLEKEENARHAYEALVERKVFEYLSGIVKRKEKQVSYDEFVKIIREHSHAH